MLQQEHQVAVVEVVSLVRFLSVLLMICLYKKSINSNRNKVMHLDDNTASLSYKDSTVPQLKGSVVTSLLLKEKPDNTLLSFIKKSLYLFTSVEMSMTQDSSSNKSESSQLTAEGWCRSKLVIECEFDFESCNIMGNRARVFLNKQSERIHFDENTSHLVFCFPPSHHSAMASARQ